jgi:hypothetical protein
MRLRLFKPNSNGGSEITSMQLFRNSGNANDHPTIQVTTYTSNLLEHTLDVVEDALETGATYKFVFSVTNSVGISV